MQKEEQLQGGDEHRHTVDRLLLDRQEYHHDNSELPQGHHSLPPPELCAVTKIKECEPTLRRPAAQARAVGRHPPALGRRRGSRRPFEAVGADEQEPSDCRQPKAPQDHRAPACHHDLRVVPTTTAPVIAAAAAVAATAGVAHDGQLTPHSGDHDSAVHIIRIRLVGQADARSQRLHSVLKHGRPYEPTECH